MLSGNLEGVEPPKSLAILGNWEVVRADVEVSVRNSRLSRGTVLDMNGMAVGQASVTRIPDGVRLAFPQDAMYVVLE